MLGLQLSGQLGYGHQDTIGDDEAPASAGDVDIGGDANVVRAGFRHTCASRQDGPVLCWGIDSYGVLGQPNGPVIVGDDELPASVGTVNAGQPIVDLDAFGSHVCVLLSSDAVRCWGFGYWGMLGYGNTDNVGDDEHPADAGDVEVF